MIIGTFVPTSLEGTTIATTVVPTTLAGRPGSNSLLSCRLARKPENFCKNCAISREKMRKFRRKCNEIDLSVRNSKKSMENWINYNILQIYLTNCGRFLEKFLAAKVLGCTIISSSACWSSCSCNFSCNICSCSNKSYCNSSFIWGQTLTFEWVRHWPHLEYFTILALT